MEMPSVLSQLRQPNGVMESQSPLTKLVAALEHATQSAKQLSHRSSSSSSSSSSDPCHLLNNAFASLRNAHLQIASFLDRFQSSMKEEEEEEEEEEEDEAMAVEEDSSTFRAMEKVQEGMRDCALRNAKRCKRPLSPSLGAEDGTREPSSYDPTQRQRSLDLILQFHG